MTTTPSIEIKRHYKPLTEKETDELVGAVADLIVAFVMKNRKDDRRKNAPADRQETEQKPTGR